jgi:signal transduction histidine kinase
VIENLAGNAVKYGAKDTPITLSLKHLGAHVELRVHNFGGELSPDDQKGLFDLFQRTRTAIASGQKGWGIGLTLVKGIVEAHGGRVSVKSGPGLGTAFIVSLPFSPA